MKNNDKKQQPTLPGMGELKKTNKMLAKEFISDLQTSGWIDERRRYFDNYRDASYAISKSQIKVFYTKYVLEGNWSVEKFKDVLANIIDNRKMMYADIFMEYGIKYDEKKDGNVGYNTTVEQPKRQKLNFTDEEIAEMLKNMM